jgi:hypothetical protein
VEDALFCHKCGRPLREIANLEPEQVLPVQASNETAAQPLPPAGIGFSNQVAVRTAVLVAGLTSILSAITPLPAFLVLFWRMVVLLAAGFAAVYLYHRRTGLILTVRGGVRMGWLTGFFSFVITVVVSVISLAVLSASKGGLSAFWQSQLEQYSNGSPETQQALKILESPEGLLFLAVLSLATVLVIFTALAMIGGALGAKVLEKE